MTREEAIKCLIDAKEEFAYFRNHVVAFDMAIEALKQPKRKKGKWIDTRVYCGEFLCSNCHETNINNFYKYCPNCGAEMKGSVENEVRD
ncbi:MAG: hypothetical protein IJI41_06945 [Anaerolineaceae bacterium]|nr:hypothetical protein [Anaerolineaceae bacterium]